MARDHYENFPVGSLLAPKSRRRHVYSIYAFARTADDFADEGYDGDTTAATRLARLDEWQKKLEDCCRGEADDPVFVALSATIRELGLPVKLFEDLLSAFRQDVTVSRYRDFDEVLDYCSRSAKPVGRLILLLFGHRDDELHRMSDSICTGLQLANFWQDVSVDILKDRVYLPQDEMARFGVTVDDLRTGAFSDRYAALMRFQVERTREIFDRGRMLPKLVKGRLALELRLTWLGGMRILERIESLGYDTLRSRPVITLPDKVRLLMRSLLTR
ncbi:MAG: squalene synthase HpnC [Acidobacteriota bacterium]|nr:MAG: squalene synthase HpnC [Acidobacteriota bacterium]